ncbi:hypothetical protein [[Leptolyngbya] sp. PCC 7376]|uniref:hypothetical protein n=1 Tax=[Leptolyngbya] sp. PCC 7376 TaxID=111781 RepID=UPI001356E5CA|nr:hypothetical protein [[Leptolyngbya] sp. PCC 7376]
MGQFIASTTQSMGYRHLFRRSPSTDFRLLLIPEFLTYQNAGIFVKDCNSLWSYTIFGM